MNPVIRVAAAGGEPLVLCGLRALVSAETDLRYAGDAAGEPLALYRRLTPDVLVLAPLARGGLGELVRAGARVLVLADVDGDEHVHRAFQVGAAGYLLTRDPLEAIAPAIRAVAAGRRALGPEVQRLLEEAPPRALLTEREHEILRELARGESNRAIAATVGCLEGTIKVHVSHILDKLGATARAGAVVAALTRGHLELPRPAGLLRPGAEADR